MAKEIVTWEAKDGKIFESKERCVEHEMEMDLLRLKELGYRKFSIPEELYYSYASTDESCYGLTAIAYNENDIELIRKAIRREVGQISKVPAPKTNSYPYRYSVVVISEGRKYPLVDLLDIKKQLEALIKLCCGVIPGGGTPKRKTVNCINQTSLFVEQNVNYVS